MYIENLGEIKAVAFDIDGTLYRTWQLNVRMAVHCVIHNQFFLKYGLVRAQMHKRKHTPNFTKVQAQLMAKKMHTSTEKAEEKLQKIVYKGLEKYFKKIPACKGCVELIKELNKTGYKIGILSDFPPEQKGDIWGIKPFCHVILGSEEAGALKPSDIPFSRLAQELNVPPQEILYVGNSHKYDVVGAKKVGMKTAWLISPVKAYFGKRSKMADITFWDYEQLKNTLLYNINEGQSEISMF